MAVANVITLTFGSFFKLFRLFSPFPLPRFEQPSEGGESVLLGHHADVMSPEAGGVGKTA